MFNRKTLSKRRAFAAIALAAGLVSLSACSASGGDGGGSGDGGGDDAAPFKLGLFMSGNDNAYLQAEIAAAEATAEELGVELTVTASSWDPQAQNAAFQLAQQRESYDGWLITAVSPTNQCDPILNAAESGIPIVMVATAICDDDGYTEGTLAWVGEQSSDSYNTLFSYIREDAPQGNLAVIVGPQLDYASETAKTAAELQLDGENGVVLSTVQHTDYLAETAYQAAQTIIQSDPNLVAIASNYSGMTRGVVEAVKQSGRDIVVYDSNGDTWTSEQIQAGTIRAALPGTPATNVILGMRALVDHLNGKEIETTINPLASFTFPDAPIVNSNNVLEWEPEY